MAQKKNKKSQNAHVEYDAAGVPMTVKQPVTEKTEFHSYKELEELSQKLTEEDRR